MVDAQSTILNLNSKLWDEADGFYATDVDDWVGEWGYDGGEEPVYVEEEEEEEEEVIEDEDEPRLKYQRMGGATQRQLHCNC
ncbi:hypothetical protein QQ045_027076 [Rhodiola kirilowii]